MADTSNGDEPALTPPSAQDSKARWRRWAKAVRARTAVSVRQGAQSAIVNRIRAWQPYGAARHVLTYLAFGDEIDLAALQEDGGKLFYTTRTWQGRDALTVHPVAAGLETHPFGYLQPRADAPETDPALIDLALVPGLCFSRTGSRIGYGQGYYDRLLPSLRSSAPRAAVSLDTLIVPYLPQDVYDVPVTHLLSEAGVYEVSPPS